MLNLIQFEKTERHLLSLSAVVDLQQSRATGFGQAALDWLIAGEDALRAANLASGVGSIAALRSRLLAGLQSGEPSQRSRKARDLITSRVLEEAQRVMSQSLEPTAARVREAEQLAFRVVAVARAKGVLADLVSMGFEHQATLQQLQAALERDPDTASALVHMIGLVGRFDALVVLDRATPELR
jgi:hypothetical protein